MSDKKEVGQEKEAGSRVETVLKQLVASFSRLGGCCQRPETDAIGGTVSRKRVGILFREYCFRGENSLSLTEFWGKLGEFCEKLGEFVLAHK